MGLTLAAYVYGSAVIVMTLASMIAIAFSSDWGSRPRRICKSQ